MDEGTNTNIHKPSYNLLLGAGGRSNLKQIGVLLELVAPNKNPQKGLILVGIRCFFLGGERADLYEIQRQSP